MGIAEEYGGRACGYADDVILFLPGVRIARLSSGGTIHTSKTYDPSPSAGTGTCETVKKGNAFQLVNNAISHMFRHTAVPFEELGSSFE
jgi:hypothetical protein